MGLEGVGDGGVEVRVFEGDSVREGKMGGELLREWEVGVKKGVGVVRGMKGFLGF